MNLDVSRCWAEIDLDALLENCRTLHGLIPRGCRLMHILKADAYGHGAVPAARALGAAYPEDWIGVACLSEALELRDAGIRQEILILGFTPPEAAELLARRRVTQTLLSPDYTRALAACAEAAGVRVSCHLKADTGMTRIGYPAYGGDLAGAVSEAITAYRTPFLKITGIFTHFSSSYSHAPEDDRYTRTQFGRFLAFCRSLEAAGIRPGLRHCCNSPATVNSPEYALDMCRAGTVLYGLLPAAAMLRPAVFRPVMTWKARVVQRRSVPAGTPVSYGRLALAETPMELAVVSAGDADGYPRSLTNLGRVRIRGRVCPVVGRVCMDMFMADVSGVPEAAAGDEVLLLGGGGEDGVPCEWLYGPLGLGPSAITCNVRGRVPRIFRGAGVPEVQGLQGAVPR